MDDLTDHDVLALMGALIHLSGEGVRTTAPMSPGQLALFLVELAQEGKRKRGETLTRREDGPSLPMEIARLIEEGLDERQIVLAAYKLAAFNWHAGLPEPTMQSTTIAYNMSVYALYFVSKQLDEAIDRIEALEEQNGELQERADEAVELCGKWEGIALSFQKSSNHLSDYLDMLRVRHPGVFPVSPG